MPDPPQTTRPSSVSELVEALRQGGPAAREEGVLVGVSLVAAQLDGVDLSGLDLSGADLTRATLNGASLVGTRLDDAILDHAVLVGAELLGASLRGADLSDVRAEGAGFGGADATEADFFNANLEGATFTKGRLAGADFGAANLKGARLREADLSEANLVRADLRGADLEASDVQRANLGGARLSGARLRNVTGYSTASWIGAEIVGTDFTGAYRVRRRIMDENFLDEFKTSSSLNAALYWLWWVTSDCGRSLLRWSLLTLVLTLAFAAAYTQVGVDYGDYPTPLSPFYYSVVTLTTLGYGDVLPATAPAQVVAMLQVVVGYVMLGGLISILSGKMARRAD